MTRPPFIPRKVLLRSPVQRDTLLALIPNLPLDEEYPLAVTICDHQPARTPDQNSLMWTGPLKDIAAQAWVEGRQYSADVWHEYLKRTYLPEKYENGLTKENYRKWDIDPAGNRVLVGSTTQLTKKGMSEYLTQVEAHGGSLGVLFTERSAA